MYLESRLNSAENTAMSGKMREEMTSKAGRDAEIKLLYLCAEKMRFKKI